MGISKRPPQLSRKGFRMCFTRIFRRNRVQLSLFEKYTKLDEKLAKKLIIEDKWIDAVSVVVYGQLDQLIQSFTKRLIELEDRYKSPLPTIEKNRVMLSKNVHKHLEEMGIQWE